jgi:hypothetical protein
MRTAAARFDDAPMRDIFDHPKLRRQPRIIVETFSDEVTANAIVN